MYIIDGRDFKTIYKLLVKHFNKIIIFISYIFVSQHSNKSKVLEEMVNKVFIVTVLTYGHIIYVMIMK